MSRARFLLSACLLLCLGACSAPSTAAQVPSPTDNGANYFPDATWRTASPGSQRFDATRFDGFTSDINNGRYGVVDGVVVIRHGYVIHEQYYNGWRATRAHTMQSVSKSVTSLLVGILSKTAPAGVALDRKVLNVFTRYPTIANVDPRKEALTLRDLLTMRTSMDFYEQPYDGSPLQQLNSSTGDWVKYVLDRPMTGTPGSSWAYNSGAAIVMGGVIREVSGINVDVFARQQLFAPLGITSETWARSPFDGLPHTGGGLGLKLTDLARIGYLVLRHGKWGEAQLVPRTWLDESTRAVSHGNLIFNGFNPGYGQFWWTFPITRGGSDDGVIAASGSGGQWLFIVPSLDLVIGVIATSGNGLDLLYDLLPVVR